MIKDSLRDQMEYLKSLAQFTPSKVVEGKYELSLDAIKELLEFLGNPQDCFPIIHVAGTNGKGSTIAFLSSILRASGLRVGVFTSPALVSVTEQIQINGTDISEDDLSEMIKALRPKLDMMKSIGHKLTTEFETVTVAALLYFLREKCDIVILECGLGGTNDATNVIGTPLLSVITSIGLDHTEILGSTLPEIASQKAGIIKNSGTAVVMQGPADVMDVFIKRCRDMNAGLVIVPHEDKFINGISLGLKGNYQTGNASLAKACALELRKKGYEITDADISAGLKNAVWPCRFEIVRQKPLFIIDGGHNPDGIEALTDSLKLLRPDTKINFIIGILKDKNYEKIADMVIPLAGKFYAVTVPSPRALDAGELKKCLTDKGAVAESYDSYEAAVKAALSDCPEDGVICAFGSLYYVGYVRKYLLSLPEEHS